jgi:hypothetical protein
VLPLRSAETCTLYPIGSCAGETIGVSLRLRGDSFATEESVPVMRGDKAGDVHDITTASSTALSDEFALRRAQRGRYDDWHEE